MTEKQWRESLEVLGFRGWDKNTLVAILDLINKGFSINSIATDGKNNMLYLGDITLDPKTVRRMRDNYTELYALCLKYEGNLASVVNEEHYTSYEKDLPTAIETNKIRGGIASIKGDNLSRDRLETMLDLEQQIPDDKWNVQYLQSIGFSEDESLEILTSRDSIYLYRQNAQVVTTTYNFDDYDTRVAMGIKTPSISKATPQEPVKHLANFIGFNTYVELYYRVKFQAMNQQTAMPPKTQDSSIPRAYTKVATTLITKGLFDDELLVRTGEAIVRYAIWRGEKYLQAFKDSLRVWKDTEQEHKRYMNSVIKMIELEGKNG